VRQLETAHDPSQRILQAARRLFFARGFAKTQLRAIATEAGTSESGVLRFFESKTFLLRAVCESCWAEVNAMLDERLKQAAERDPDPRSLLVELMRAVLTFARTNEPMMTFLQTHFASPEAIGFIPADNGSNGLPSAGREFHRYLERIKGLCTDAIEVNPGFVSAGVTVMALTHVAQSAIYGIQASWYISDQEQAPESDKLSIEEGVAVLRCLLYQNAAS
jgi:AcrR family transcriptional regulator